MTETDKNVFNGSKLILFLGARLFVIRRDDFEGLPWPGYLDLPGGERDGLESGVACILRETFEETGLLLREEDLVWCQFYTAPERAWYFAAHLPQAAEQDVVFGDEGQGWMLMPPEEFATSDEAVPHFRDRVGDYLNVRAGQKGRGPEVRFSGAASN